MQRAQEAAAAAGCGHLLARRPGQLSGGERQRVALARAIVREPDIFLLDEPLSNLDLETRVETRAELKALHARVGGTMVHVTHDQTEALVLGDRIAVMRDGLLEQVGTPDEIWRLPATTFVARFVGSPAMNLLPADGPLRPVDTPPDVELTAARQIGFRPESVVLGHGDAAILLGHGDRTPGVVERVDVVGEDAYAYVRVAGLAVVARVPAIARPRQGDEVRMAIRWRDAHLFEASTGRRLASP
jgi:ABC-type sugar transport system ATPase subunit